MDDLLNYAPCGFVSFRDDGTIISANETLKEILEYSNDNLEGRNFETLLTIASRIFYNTHFFPLIRLHLKADEIFLSLRGKNKIDIPVLANAVRKQKNGVYENHCIFMPVYQRKKYEDEILNARKLAEDTLKKNESLISLAEKLESHSRELDKQVTRLSATNENLVQFNKIISHDFQEPIRKIQMFSDIILREEAGNISFKSKATLEKIVKSAERLRQLTVVLEQFVKVDAEKNVSNVDLNHVLNTAKSKLTDEKQFYDFELVAEGLPIIEAYPTQLELLFSYLLDNAIEYRDQARKLIINVKGVIIKENVFRSTKDRYKFSDYVKILFSDNGIGFENQFNEYVFSLLTKINPSSKGIGLGLPLSKKIVENHSGTISINSEPENGTVVKILLPTHIT